MKVLTKRKNCFACRVYQKANLHERSTKCPLGYKVEVYLIKLIIPGHRPLEQCPKPITWADYEKEMKNVRRQNKRSN